MDFGILKLTGAGLELLARNMAGDTGITFKSIVIGSGKLIDVDAATQLGSQKMAVNIAEMNRENAVVTLTATIDNGTLENDLKWTEIGVIASDDEEVEILFAYAASESGDGAVIPRNDGATTVENLISVQVYVGAASEILASVKSVTYATNESLSEHTENKNNPHRVTAEQIGLGNVKNVSPNNQKVTYQAGESLEELKSGETMTNAMKKIAYAVKKLIEHLKEVTPVSKGGTGATTASAARANLGAFSVNGGTLHGGVRVEKTSNSDIYDAEMSINGSNNVVLAKKKNNSDVNYLRLHDDKTLLKQPLTVESGGTGAKTAAAALTNLGAEIDGLVHAQHTVSSDVDITSKLNTEITGMKECSARYIMLNVSGGTASLESGTWHLLVTKLTTSYALVTATRYSVSVEKPRPLIKYKSLVAKSWSDWYVPGTILDSSQYGSNLPTAGTAGRVFFKLID